MKDIASLMLKQLQKRLEEQDLTLSLTDKAIEKNC